MIEDFYFWSKRRKRWYSLAQFNPGPYAMSKWDYEVRYRKVIGYCDTNLLWTLVFIGVILWLLGSLFGI
jgi:hypothetical protein